MGPQIWRVLRVQCTCNISIFLLDLHCPDYWKQPDHPLSSFTPNRLIICFYWRPGTPPPLQCPSKAAHAFPSFIDEGPEGQLGSLTQDHSADRKLRGAKTSTTVHLTSKPGVVLPQSTSPFPLPTSVEMTGLMAAGKPVDFRLELNAVASTSIVWQLSSCLTVCYYWKDAFKSCLSWISPSPPAAGPEHPNTSSLLVQRGWVLVNVDKCHLAGIAHEVINTK